MFNNFSFEDRGVYETMWKNTVRPDRSQIKIRHMRIHVEYLRLQTHIQNM